ncbi:MAG TPA: 2Fe-2S iron-sulfur cluster-binding protein [Rectinemataceae bacterium]|nr:2Fe-2S iron-sulfur cluster-binding protein [Rectinemataceae bacterium]
MPKITIDGHEIEVAPGTSILNAARQIGGDIVPPAMCYYSKLKGSGGKCRTCLVKVTVQSATNPRPMPKLQASCSTPVADGMVVENITSAEVLDARKGIVEFLLINHPLDCPICDQAGECDLQDLAYAHGLSSSRYEFPRRTFEKIDIGEKIQLHMTRCIMCFRCVYTADQVAKKRVHGILKRGDAAEIGTYIQNSLDSDFIGNVIDVCPVGALTDKTARFKNRVWFLKPMDVHRSCDKCSGEAVAWMKGDEVIRVTARRDQNGEVESWICDDCRFERKQKTDWVFEAPRQIARGSVIGQNHYTELRQLLAVTEKHLAARAEAQAAARAAGLAEGSVADPAALISG